MKIHKNGAIVKSLTADPDNLEKEFKSSNFNDNKKWDI